MSAILINPAILFAEPDHGDCCDCCAGYCPKWEADSGDGYDDMLVSLEVGDVEYLGTRVCMIRRDVLADLPEKVSERVVTATKVDSTWAVVPASRPALSKSPQAAELLDRLDSATITRHVGEGVVHLYVGDTHVGWCKWSTAKAGIQSEDLPMVRRIASECGITLNTAAVALHLSQVGAS